MGKAARTGATSDRLRPLTSLAGTGVGIIPKNKVQAEQDNPSKQVLIGRPGGGIVLRSEKIGQINALTAEIDENYNSIYRRCRKILIGSVVRGAKTVVVRGKSRIST